MNFEFTQLNHGFRTLKRNCIILYAGAHFHMWVHGGRQVAYVGSGKLGDRLPGPGDAAQMLPIMAALPMHIVLIVRRRRVRTG